MESDEDILQRLAKDGSMDLTNWPIVLPGLVKRIEENAHTQFPAPNIRDTPGSPTPIPRFLGPTRSSDTLGRPSSPSPPADSQDDKENAGPPSSPGPSSLPVPTATNARTVPGLMQPPIAPGRLPGPITRMLDEITSTILTQFSDYPPHTIQRLAELVLKPKEHYRSLTAYLHALDRVVHVTSGSNIYPLPPTFFNTGDTCSVLNGGEASNGAALGTAPITTSSNIDDEEALGGALLTPIPWLSSQPNGTGSSEDGMGSEDGSIDSPVSTRSDSAIAQASPPRQQQQTSPQGQRSPSQNASVSNSPRPQIRTDTTETIDGPNGTGTIETVSVSMVNGVPTMSTSTSSNTVLASRGVTQGELLRQEQRAGVVPLTQLVRQQQQEARAQAEINNSNAASGEEASTDSDSPMGDQEPDIEAPHARGPDEIDDADIGPQRATTSHPPIYTIGATPEGASIKMQAMDIEAAVGRHVDGTPIEEPRKTTPEHDAETTVPPSPKRDAEEDLQDPTASKKQKTDEEQEPKEGEDTVMVPADVPSTPNGEAETAERGDVVIRDPDPTEAHGEEKNDKSD